MKNLGKLVVYCSLGVITFSVAACSGEANHNEKEETTAVVIDEANLFIADYSIDGMVCAMGCAKTIQDEVAEMTGVSACSVDFESGKAHIEFDQSQLSESQIIAAIEGMADGQYKVNQWEEKQESEATEEAVHDELEEGSNSENTSTEVSLPSFEIPNLFKLLFNQL